LYASSNVRHLGLLDESGTHAQADHLLVGAVVAPDRDAVEAADAEAFADVALQPANWNNDGEIAAFVQRGFHFSQDNVSVRSEFIRRISTMNIRVHAAYSRSGMGSEWRTRHLDVPPDHPEHSAAVPGLRDPLRFRAGKWHEFPLLPGHRPIGTGHHDGLGARQRTSLRRVDRR
jgi:hypothetical protein